MSEESGEDASSAAGLSMRIKHLEHLCAEKDQILQAFQRKHEAEVREAERRAEHESSALGLDLARLRFAIELVLDEIADDGNWEENARSLLGRAVGRVKPAGRAST